MTPGRQTTIIFHLAFLCTIVACEQTNFTIVGTGKHLRDGDSLYLSYTENDEYILKKTTAKDKKFTFTGLVQEPIQASIYRNENPIQLAVATEYLPVYLEPGTIHISSPDTLTGATVSGTPLNDTFQSLQSQLKPLHKKLAGTKDPFYFTEAEKKDTALVHRNIREIKRITFAIEDIRLAFAEEHPDSYVSLDILVHGSKFNTYIGKVEAVYNQLEEHLRQTSRGAIISERIRKKHQVEPGMKAIDFAMEDPEGDTINLSAFYGKYVLLDFWASWCAPCRAEHPNLRKQYEKYKDNNFTILSVSIDTEKEKWIEAIAKDQLMWTQISDLKAREGSVFLKYGITSIPANFLIDPDGMVISKDLKGDDLAAELSSIFATAK